MISLLLVHQAHLVCISLIVACMPYSDPLMLVDEFICSANNDGDDEATQGFCPECSIRIQSPVHTHSAAHQNFSGCFVSCPSSSRSLHIAHSIHPADALPLSSCEPSDAASMSLPSHIRSIISSYPSLSGEKSVSICWKVCCCIW